jgi:hypothetical protein
MPIERCPECGKLISQESLDACDCGNRSGANSEPGMDGVRFVRLILAIAALMAVLAVGLFYVIVWLRTIHGLSGLGH